MSLPSCKTNPDPVFARLFAHLYLRIWLAILASVVLLSLLIGTVWYFKHEEEQALELKREMVVRNADDIEIFRAPMLPMIDPAYGLIFEVQLDPNIVWEDTVYLQLPPRPPGPMDKWLSPGGITLPGKIFLWFIAVLGTAIALGTYPLVRRITKRLETLQLAVGRWGTGELATRVPVQGHDEVASLALRFNEAAQHIENLVNSHKSLLANASHELRSPLTRIRMALELASADLHPGTKKELVQNIGELDQLIDEILLASRLDDPAAQLGPIESIDLTALLAEECSRTGTILTVEADPPSVILEGSTKLVRRMLRNLLENAKKYSSAPINLSDTSVRIGEHNKGTQAYLDKHSLRICDYGMGVAPEFRERIFEPFFRAPGASEQYGGVGLGLSLVKTIAKHHGASITCTDRPDGLPGACFVLQFAAQDKPPTHH